MISWDKVKYFTPREFADPDFPESGEHIDPVTLLLLEKLRRDTGWPIITHAAVGGCIDVEGKYGHASRSYHLLSMGAKAVDFHFETKAPPRVQFHEVMKVGFTGVGLYYAWYWKGKRLPIGFHVDTRPVEKTQVWIRDSQGRYRYLLH